MSESKCTEVDGIKSYIEIIQLNLKSLNLVFSTCNQAILEQNAKLRNPHRPFCTFHTNFVGKKAFDNVSKRQLEQKLFGQCSEPTEEEKVQALTFLDHTKLDSVTFLICQAFMSLKLLLRKSFYEVSASSYVPNRDTTSEQKAWLHMQQNRIMHLNINTLEPQCSKGTFGQCERLWSFNGSLETTRNSFRPAMLWCLRLGLLKDVRPHPQHFHIEPKETIQLDHSIFQ